MDFVVECVVLAVECVEGEVECREPKSPVRRDSVVGGGEASCLERRAGEEDEAAVEVVLWRKRGILSFVVDKTEDIS